MMSYQPLTRSKTSRIIAGVCGGLGEYFNIDPTLIRIFFCILVFAGGVGLALYLLFWIIIPESGSLRAKKPQETSVEIRQHVEQLVHVGKNAIHPSKKITSLIAFACILLGAIILVNQFFPRFSLFDFWPVIFILIGLVMLYRAFPFRNAELPQEPDAELSKQTDGK
jgi:phage shock protein C